MALDEFRYRYDFRVVFRDVDYYRHVNNAVYVTYMETARIDWFTSLGCSPNPAGEGPVLINAACTFIKQLEYPGDIEVRTFIGDFGRSSFETYHQIRRVDQPWTTSAATLLGRRQAAGREDQRRELRPYPRRRPPRTRRTLG